MANISRVHGVQGVLKNMKGSQQSTIDQVAGGLRRAGLLIQRESQQRVPVNTGQLKNSAFTRRTGPLEVRVGYTAAYALYVHENVEMKLKGQPRPLTSDGTSQGRYWDPQGRGQAKFLENAYRENLAKIRSIIAGGSR